MMMTPSKKLFLSLYYQNIDHNTLLPMMGKYARLFVVIICILGMSFILNFSVSAQSIGTFKDGKEPDGFRGIKWGTHIKKTKGLELQNCEGNWCFYKKKKDKLVIGGVPLLSVSYAFEKGIFMYSCAVIADKNNWIDLRNTLEDIYGKCLRDDSGNMCFWEGNKTTIMLKYIDQSNVSVLWIKYKGSYASMKAKNDM